MSGWVRFENTTAEHPKLVGVSDKAFRLWFNASCYCSRNETDGRIPAAIITRLSDTATSRVVAELLAARLLDRLSDEMYVMHDYLDYNPSRARIHEMRRGTRERVAKFRNGNADVTALRDEGCNDVTPHGRDRTASVKDLSSLIKEKEENDARELFDYWREKCEHPAARPTGERLSKIRARRREGYTNEQVRAAIDGAARAAFVNDAGKRFDDIELICRNGSKLESFIDRAAGNASSAPLSRTERIVNDRNRFIDH